MKPTRIVIYIWCAIALLGAVCWLVPEGGWKIGDKEIHWPTLAEVLVGEDMSGDRAIDSLLLADLETELLEQDTILPVIPKEIVKNVEKELVVDTVFISCTADKGECGEYSSSQINSTINHYDDTRKYLSQFYEALDSTDMMPIRVVHYGDSQIEEDRITSILRENLQNEFGGGGVGLIPLHQTIPTRSLRQRIVMNNEVQSTQGGPKRYLAYGPRTMRMNGSDYGPMAQVAIMDSTIVSGSESIKLVVEPFDSKRKSYNYFSRLRILADRVRVKTLKPKVIVESSVSSSFVVVDSAVVILPDSTTRFELILQGHSKIYGLSLESPTGIIVDNIPMRGSSGTIFTRINSRALEDFYVSTNTRLIIMQFGGNMIPATKNTSTINGYVNQLRQQVQYIRNCAPNAAILFIGPSDMATSIEGKMGTYPLVPYMDKMLLKMASEEKIGYWSLYQAMGGYNSMITWRNKGLAGSDYVHFTRSGANKAGELLYEWLIEGAYE